VEKEIANLAEQSQSLRSHWQMEKEIISVFDRSKKSLIRSVRRRARLSATAIWRGRPSSNRAIAGIGKNLQQANAN
jgi:hypothetical protein